MTIIQAQPLKQFGISGPASALDNEVPIFDGTTGKKIKAATGITSPSSGRLKMSSTAPYLTLHNIAHEDTDYGRKSELIFKGEQSGGEETTLGIIQVAHDGTADDQKGIMSFKVNDGNDADAPGTAMTILANGNVGIGTTLPVSKFQVDGVSVFGEDIFVMQEADIGNANRSIVEADADPHLRVYSSDATQATDYVEMYHNQTYGNVYAPTQLRLTGGTHVTITAPEVNLDATSADGVVKFKNNEITFLGIAGNATHEETRWTMNDVFGNMIIFTNYAFRTINHDHAVQTNPTVFIHSDTNPNTNNTEWGSLAFIGTGSGGGYFNIANGVGDIVMQPIGNVGIGTTSPNAKLDINSDIIRLRTTKTPASAGAAGNQGDECWDADYHYRCVATNTWKRTALTTW